MPARPRRSSIHRGAVRVPHDVRMVPAAASFLPRSGRLVGVGSGCPGAALCWTGPTVGCPIRTVPWRDPLTTVRTGVVLLQPGLDAEAVEPMRARQIGDFLTDEHLVHTDRAFSPAVVVEHASLYSLLRESGDGLGVGGAGGVSCRILFHQLGDHPIQSFLRINSVSVRSRGRVQKGRKQRRERIRRVSFTLARLSRRSRRSRWTMRTVRTMRHSLLNAEQLSQDTMAC